MTTALREETRSRADDLHALEELWAAPAVDGRGVGTPRRRLPQIPGGVLAGGWLAFLVAVSALAPDPEPGMVWAAWAVGASIGVYALLALASFIALLGRSAGAFATAALAGALLIPLAVNCRASAHHLGNWWLAELGAALVLTGLAAAGVAQRRRG